MKAILTRIIAVSSLLVLLTGCAVTGMEGQTRGLSDQVSKDESITIGRLDGKLYFCPTARLVNGDCNLTGRTVTGEVVSGWMSPQVYVEAVVRAPLHRAPVVTDDPAKGITLKYLRRFHIVPQVMTFPLS